MIFAGPSAPKFIADMFVVSENVGEGGPGDTLRLEPNARLRRERGRLGAMSSEIGRGRAAATRAAPKFRAKCVHAQVCRHVPM